jgi:hypothetical protein
MAFHRCTIHGADGAVVVEGVKVMIEEEEGDEGGWHGTLSVTHRTPVLAGQRYRLVLDDGRSGEILIRRNTFAGGDDRAVAFRGQGPLR